MIFEEMLKEERAAGFAKGRAEGVAEAVSYTHLDVYKRQL